MRCIDCGATTSEVVELRDAVIRLRRCSRCGLVYREDWPAAFVPDLYDYYRERMEWKEQRVYPPVNSRRVAQVLNDLGDRVPGRKLLDVGCGAGGVVYVASRSGWEARGIDLSAPAVALAQRFDVACECLDFFDPSLDEERYDVIVMSEVIEHVPHPSRFLARARDLLAPSGLLYLTTPNYASLGRRLLGGRWRAIHPEHLSYFTPRSLIDAAAAVGLTVEDVATVNLSLAAVRALVGRAPVRSEVSAVRAEEQGLRETIEGTRSLRLAKRLVNAALRATGTGESMRAILRPRSDLKRSL